MALINCIECNAQISDKAKKCPKCGVDIIVKEKVKCYECNTELEMEAKECYNCGAEQLVNKVKIPQSVNEEEAIINTEIKRTKIKWIVGISSILIIATIVILIINKNQPSAEEVAKEVIKQDSIKKSKEPTSASIAKSDAIEAQRQADSMAKAAAEAMENSLSKNDVDNIKQELLNTEIKSPLTYLSVHYNLDVKIRLIKESEDIIKGTIYNSATMATFKDAVIQVDFSTETGTVIETKYYTLYKYFMPGKSKNFQINVISPSGTRKIGVYIVSASPYS